MHPDLHARVASARLKDDHSRLDAEEDGTATLEPTAITIRPLREEDATAVERLAELDSAPVPPGRLLVAEVDGEVEAALAVETGEAVADPFAASAETVSLLHVRAEQLRAA